MKQAATHKAVLLFWMLCVLTALPGFSANYSINVSINGSGGVSRNPTNSTFPAGSVVTLTASPADGWSFSGWSGDATGGGNPTNVTMDTNKFVTANFQLLPVYTLTSTISGQGTVELDPPGGSYRSNTTVSVHATPSTNWQFLEWTGAAVGNSNPVNVVMNSAKTINATFVEPVRIVQQPRDASGSVGENVMFEVVAAGSGTLGYQWRFNGVLINGATGSSYIRTNIQPRDAGQYSVVVTNLYGSEPSRLAQLQVNAPCSGTNVVTECTEAALRTAIGTGGIIKFCCNGTIVLTNTIVVTNNITLDATDHSVAISGNNRVRLFIVESGAQLSARYLAFADGNATGTNGADSSGCPTCPPPGVGGPGQGGGFFNQGELNLSFCTLSNNQAVGGLGGTTPFGGSAAPGGLGAGGAVYNNGGSVAIDNSLVISNRALGGPSQTGGGFIESAAGTADGGALSSLGGAVRIFQTTIASNLAFTGVGGGDVRGGGVFLGDGSNVISNSQFLANRAASQQSFSGRAANCGGGAVFSGAGQLLMIDDRVTGNSASGGAGWRHAPGGRGDGGGIYSLGLLRLDRCTISENSGRTGRGGSANPAEGGGLYNGGTAVVTASGVYSNTIAGAQGGGGSNVADPCGNGYGGGIFNRGNLAITNATIALNSAEAGFSQFYPSTTGSAYGGGLHSRSGSVFLMNVTVASNSVVPGVAFGQEYGASAGANLGNESAMLSLRNSLVAYPGVKSNAWGSMIDGGFNISSDGSCQFSSGASFNFTDPKLGGMADNGGPTFTMMPAADSAALDFASGQGAPTTDQRGATRPFGAGYDAGAVERGAQIISSTALAVTRENSNLVIRFTAQAGVSYEIQSSTNLTNWALKEQIDPSPADPNVVRAMGTGSWPREFFRVKVR